MSPDNDRAPVSPRLLDWIQLGSAGAAATIAALAWLGWLLEIPTLKSVLPDGLPMNPKIVLGCFLGALAVLLRRKRPRAATGLSLAVLLVGVVAVAEWHFDVDLRLDEAIVPKLGSAKPGRMAPIVAYSFLLLGASALLILRGRVLAGQILSIVPGAITILVSVARANAVRFDMEQAPFFSVAYNTTMCLGLLVIAVLFLEPHRGFLKLFNSDTFGGAMARRLLPVAVLAPITLSRLSMEGYERGWYDENMTGALLTLGSIGVFSATVYGFAARLHRVDRDRRRAREAQSAAATRLRHLNDELMQFTYSASHDIKGPLTTILGLSRLAAEDIRAGNAAEAQQLLRHIERRALALSTLLDETLALTRNDLTQESPELVSVAGVAREVIDELRPFAARSRVNLTIDADGSHEVTAEPTRLRTALRNLVENAVVYSDPSKSERWARVRIRDGGPRQIRIEVIDNGIGIPADAQKDVFRVYRRFHPDHAEGTGLGLAIVKRNAVHLGGSVDFHSGAGGTTFSMTLPRRAALLSA